VGGGWVQHDEALSDFESVISQIERGHNFIKKAFDIPHPNIAWQIDPFGHSALTPTLMQKFGYEALVINRIDEDFKKQMQLDGNLEFMWEGADLGSQAAVLTHVLYDHYEMPGFINPKSRKDCWKVGNEDYW
jgi:hypothetical protein